MNEWNEYMYDLRAFVIPTITTSHNEDPLKVTVT